MWGLTTTIQWTEPMDEANGRVHCQKPMALGTFRRIGFDQLGRWQGRRDVF